MRIQFTVSDHRQKEIEEMMERTGSETKRELLNHALTVLKWILDEKQKGSIVASFDEENKKYKELVLAGFKP
jgi:hypothetical protein